MSDAASKIAVALLRYGRAMVLRRRVGTTSAFTDVLVHGVTQTYKPGELLGGLVQGDQQVTISDADIDAADWPGPPRKGDIIIIDGRTWALQGAETKYLGDAVLAHVLWVRGG